MAALCDRHHGVGADGIIRVFGGKDGADLAMELRNADGGLAETSGNGMRCLAQAAVEAGLVAPPSFTVWTTAGVRRVEYGPGIPGSASAWVGMGRPSSGPTRCGRRRARRRRLAEVQVPATSTSGTLISCSSVHDPADIDVAGSGRALAELPPAGRNVEFVAVDLDGALRMRVWERGVGVTRACGTGSVAAAAAARAAGLVGDGSTCTTREAPCRWPSTARRPGSGGPVHKVADIEVDVGRHPGGGVVTPDRSAFTDTLISRTSASASCWWG